MTEQFYEVKSGTTKCVKTTNLDQIVIDNRMSILRLYCHTKLGFVNRTNEVMRRMNIVLDFSYTLVSVETYERNMNFA